MIVPEDAEEVDLVKLDPEEESRRRRSQAVRNKLVLPPKHQKKRVNQGFLCENHKSVTEFAS